MSAIADVWTYRQALHNFVARDITVRYKRSILGFLWSLLSPMMLILTFIVVFKYIWHNSEPNYSVKLFCTLLTWRFFNQAVMDGASSIGSKMTLVKRVNFPKILLPLSSLIANFVDFLLSMVVLVIFFLIVRLTVNWECLPLALLALVLQMAFTFGLSLIISSLSVFYQDVQFLVGNMFQMWFFLTPVLYPASEVTKRFMRTPHPPQIYETLYFLNPLAPWMMAYKSIIPNMEPATILPNYYSFLGISAVVAFATLAIGLRLFLRVAPKFAKEG